MDRVMILANLKMKNKTQTLTQKERTKIALEEWRKQRFDLTSVVAMSQAGELMLETNSTELKVKSELDINEKRYEVATIYTIKKL